MTAPRLREQCRPPSPPDRRPSRRGGHPSPSTASAAGRPAGLARLAGARRGLVRSVRALAAAALLALCGALALPATAQAQTVEALVSNLDVGRIGNWGASTDDHALQFTTGNSGRGYVLDSIRLSLWRVPRSGKTVTVSVWTSSGDRPDALHVRLTSPSSYSADANNTFRAPSGTTLGGNNRKYFVVVKSDDTSNGAGVWRTDSDDQEPSGTEWRIANDQLRQADSNTTWGSAETLSSIFQFEIKGYTGTRPEADTGNAASSVASNGSSLDLYFTKSLDSANPPPASAFEVIVNGFPVAIGRISVADRLLSLQQLSPNILQGETVEVKYTDPTSGDDASAIQDGGGTDANHFHVSVTNGSTITKPKLTAAAVSTDGSSIGLTFSEDLDHPTYTTTIRGAFTVTVDGTDTSVTNTTGGMASVTLSVSPTIGAGQTVVVSYDESAAGTEALGDSDGNKVADFTTASRGVPAVANNSDVDRSPPMLTGAVVTSSGVAIELAFDEDLDVPATIPAALKDAFTVTAAGTEVEISSLAKNGSSGLQINLSSAILKDQAVIVSYLKSAAGTNALDDDAGNEVVDFTTGSGGFPAVVNNATELSDDATLSELEVVDVDLSPAFNAGIEMYSATVLTSHLQVTFMATTNHASATVAYLDGDGMALEDVKPGTLGHQVDTAVGPNIVKVKVTAQDGTTEKTYTVTVTRDLPTLDAATVQADGTSVVVLLQQDLPSDTGTLSTAAAAAFTVTANGVDRQITGIALGLTDAFLNVTLSTPIYQGQAVVVSYDSAAAGTNALADNAGNKFQSFTTGEDGVPAATNNSTVTFPAPSTPTSFSVTAGDKRVGLAWDAPAATDPITRHEFRYKTDGDYPDGWTEIADSAPGGANEATFTVTGLTNGTAYTFQLRAANTDNQSDAATSAEVTPVDTTPPTLSSATVCGSGDCIRLDFSENLDVSAGPLPTAAQNAFTFKVDGADHAFEVVYLLTGPNILDADFSSTIYQGQTVTVSYDQSAAGTDAVADSAGNKVASFTDFAVTNNSTQAPPAPGKPTGLTATASGSTQIDLSWTAPASDGGSAITGYRIEVSTDGSNWTDLVADTGSTDTSYSHTGLEAGDTRHYRVSAINDAGTSEPSDAMSTNTETTTTAPTIDSVAVTSTPLLTSSGGSTPDTYGAGETIEISVTFGEAVNATAATDFVLSVAGRKRAPLLRGSGTETLVFGYSVLAGDSDTDGIWIGDQTRTLVGARNGDSQNGAITSVATAEAADLTHGELGKLDDHKVDGSRTTVEPVEPVEDGDTDTAPPTVESVAVNSWPVRGGDAYGFGDTIVFTLTVSEKVRVTGQPQPKLVFDLGGSEREARYDGLSDTDYVQGGPAPEPRPEAKKLHFAYTVKPGDRDTDGVEVGELSSAIRLGGGRIRSAATDVNADLAHPALGPLSDPVDGGTAGPPAGSGVTIIDTDGAPLANNRLTIRESTRGRYGLKLNTRPTHRVDLVGGPSDGDEDLRILPTYTPLPISPDEWETPLWVDIVAVLDDDEENGERVFLNRVHSQDPAYNDLILPDVIVVEDDSHDDAGALSVADANATEGVDDTLDFVVKLARKPWRDLEVTVDYRTQDGTATAGSDYTSTSGTLTFAPGEDKKTVSVPIMDDAVEDNGETFTLVLSNASGAGFASFGQGAVGTIRNTETTARPDLTASFEGLPEAHDGESAFRFRVAFSEDIGIGYQSLRDDAFTVSGGEVTGARRVDGRNDLWEITVAPDSEPDVTITLPAGRDCQVSGAICTKGDNSRRLSNSPSATVAGPADEPETNTAAAGAPTISGTPQVGEALTASTSGISDADGLDTASFAYQWIRAGADIGGATGATYTPVAADEGERLKVRVSFTDDAGHEERLTSAGTDAVAAAPPTNTAAAGAPTISGTPQVGEALTASTSGISDADGLDTARFAYQWMRNDADIRGATGATYTPVAADEGTRLTVRVSFTDDAGNEEHLTSAATDAVAARPEPLTASFEGLPAEHAGQGSFSFRVAFSDGINISYKTVRDASFRVTGGDVTQASRVDGRRDLWKITVEPASDTAVSVRLPETTDCGASGAICTGDGRGGCHTPCRRRWPARWASRWPMRGWRKARTPCWRSR